MKLRTQFVDNALVASIIDNDNLLTNDKEALSERYLLLLEKIVGDKGGWEKINELEVSFAGGSFSSVRGITVIINALSSLHNISVFVDDGKKVSPVSIPIEPIYHALPNITSKPR